MNDELEAIRTRHNEVIPPLGFSVSLRDGQQAHNDRATLLRALDAERARRVEVEGRLGRTAEALGWFLHDERFRVAVGGNPNVVESMLTEARAVHEEAATLTKD